MLERSSQDPKKSRPPELHLSRTFDAPRRLVFAAWSSAEHVSKWFTPLPLTTSDCEIDFRPGGVFRLTMRMPDGTLYPMDARFVEIVDEERIVFTAKIHGGVTVDTTVTFAEENGKTTLQVRQTYDRETDATRGAPQGWAATLDQLGKHVTTLS
jgi:uncharacterized protein YndB with AHSA1/START domain